MPLSHELAHMVLQTCCHYWHNYSSIASSEREQMTTKQGESAKLNESATKRKARAERSSSVIFFRIDLVYFQQTV